MSSRRAGGCVRRRTPLLSTPSAMLLSIVLAGAGCAGVRSRVDSGVAAPRTVAVLPLSGSAPFAARELFRSLLVARLQDRGLRVAELAFVDRVLSQHGWLGDPEQFDGRGLAVDEALEALGTDAVLIGQHVDESRWNLLLFRRHSLGGELRIASRKGDWWRVDGEVADSGGLLLRSGQVLTEFREQGQHGTSAATLGLLDRFLALAVDTVPSSPNGELAAFDPSLVAVTARPDPKHPNRVAVSVREAAPFVGLSFGLPGLVDAQPMAADGRGFAGAVDLPAGASAERAIVVARDAFGREQTVEVAVR